MSSKAQPAGRLLRRRSSRTLLDLSLGLLAGAVLNASCFGCGQRRESQLMLHCGAGIRPPVAELVEAFGRRHGVKVECNFAGSEVLLSTIKLRGSGDLYMPGDEYYVKLAEKHGLIASSETVCFLVPVILVQKGNARNISSLADLVRPGVKVGLGDPRICAIGRLMPELFAKNGLSWEAARGEVKYWSPTVNELGDKVKLGALDAVIVWDAVAAYYADAADAIAIPPKQNVISTVAVGLLNSSRNLTLARDFVALLTSAEGKAIFRKHHYSVPHGLSM
jgi:molybdate transport system substrate-binding protein